MNQESLTRWTAISALIIALLALTVAAACTLALALHVHSHAAPSPASSSAIALGLPSSVPAPSPEPSAPPPPPPSPSPPPSSGSLRVQRLVMASSIKEHEPVVETVFRGERRPVYAFIELQNTGEGEKKIVVTFEHSSGLAVGHVRLIVPQSTKWRTWAQTRLVQKPGDWKAVVRTEEGQELGAVPFQVAP